MGQGRPGSLPTQCDKKLGGPPEADGKRQPDQLTRQTIVTAETRAEGSRGRIAESPLDMWA
jgi:hypothetical protein